MKKDEYVSPFFLQVMLTMLLVALVPGKISSTYIWKFILVLTPPASSFALVFNYKVVEQLCVISACALDVAIPGSSLYCD